MGKVYGCQALKSILNKQNIHGVNSKQMMSKNQQNELFATC